MRRVPPSVASQFEGTTRHFRAAPGFAKLAAQHSYFSAVSVSESPMKQAISGVSPPSGVESTIMTVWPSIGRTPFGQTLGRLYGIKAGIGNVLTVGNLIALASIPQALALFFLSIAPWSCLRYRLTNRRVVIERGFNAKVDKEVSLDNFDTIEVEVAPGQEWYPCANLIFSKGKIETFRIDGVPHHEGFRRACLNAQRGFAGVKNAGAKRKAGAK